MRLLSLLLTVIVAIILNGGVLSAFDQRSIDRLRRSNTCAGCDFYGANFNGANLNNANLKGANLAYATLRKASLFKADLTDADLRGTDFEGALWIDGTICQKGSIGKCISASVP